MRGWQTAGILTLSMSVFALVFTLVVAVYGSIADDRFVEQGVIPALPVLPTAIVSAVLVSVPSLSLRSEAQSEEPKPKLHDTLRR